MARTRTPPKVQIIAPGMDVEYAFVRRWQWTRGGYPAEAVLDVPNTTKSPAAIGTGSDLDIYVGTVPVWRGITTDTERLVAGNDQALRVYGMDMRHILDGIQIHDADTGPNDYGWAGIGRNLVFNAGGKPNRSASTDSNGVYEYELSPSSAELWTPSQILAFLFQWYVPTDVIRFSSDLLSGPFDEACGEVDCSTGSLASAITRVTAQTGGDWTLGYTTVYDAIAAYYQPLHRDISPPNTYTVHLDNGYTKTEPDASTAGRVRVSQTIRHAYDIVQVNSAPWVAEVTHTAIGSNALLYQHTGLDVTEDEVCHYIVDKSVYADHDLGGNLPSDADPKPWRRHLVTRRTETGYIAAGGYTNKGELIPCEETLWISNDGGSTYHRVIDGVDIEFDRARLRVKRQVTVYGDTYEDTTTLELADYTQVQIKFTVATQIEHPANAVTSDAQQYLNRHRRRTVTRSDLQPTARKDSTLPDLSTTDPHDTVTKGGTGETYDDVTTQLQQYRDQIYNSRPEIEQRVRVTLPQFPGIQIGWAITISPADYNLSNLRVISATYDAQTYDTYIVASNNLEGGIA